MKNVKLKIISAILAILIILSVCNFSIASNSEDLESFTYSGFNEKEFSNEYKEWLNLPYEERIETLEPNKYDIDIQDIQDIKLLDNVFRTSYLLGNASSTDSSYDLRTVLPKNSKVKNQNPTGCCWAFASLASLETFFAMQDKKESKPEVEYDFSEKHMAYATTRMPFLNNAINEKGYNKTAPKAEQHPANAGGTFWMAVSYLTGGMGAIAESEMPFTVPFESLNISEINNKNTITTLIDTQSIGVPETESQRQNVIQLIKQHIVSDGGVFAGIYGAQLLSSAYNNETAALYANSSTNYAPNHAIEIVGWDDSFAVSNFNESMRPSNPGAFIIKNSWGEEQNIGTMAQVKQSLYSSFTEDFNNLGYTSSDLISDESCLNFLRYLYGENKVELKNENVWIKVGENGYMYVSYEDANILNMVQFIEKALNYKNYDNVYQNEYLGCMGNVEESGYQKVYLANVYDGCVPNEEVTSVGITTFAPLDKCKIYINPNGNDKARSSLQLVELAEGDYENLTAGYHTIEFAHPIKLTGTSFVIVVEISANSSGKVNIPGITNEGQEGTIFEYVQTSAGKCFIGATQNFETGNWLDYGAEGIMFPIKAYTKIVSTPSKVLQSITITNPSTITNYNVGEQFNAEGMVVQANYSDGTNKVINNYTVTNGTSLHEGQTSVTISYTEDGVTKTAYQTITVNANTSTPTNPGNEEPTDPNNGDPIDPNNEQPQTGENETITLTTISITTKPTKITYVEGENFDKTGMVVKATYSDGSSKAITNYKVTDGTNLTKGKSSVTISYTENGVTKTTTQNITVNERQKELPTLSNFSETEGKIVKAAGYTYVTKQDKEEYVVIEVDLSGIKIGDTKSSRKFYYYLSTSKGETDIKSSYWTEFDVDETKAKITIDTRELEYTEKLKTGKNVFLYIKEVATLNGESTDMISTIQLTNNTEITIYIDDVVLDLNNIGNNTNKEVKDETTANGVIPQTGSQVLITIVIMIAIIGLGSFAYIRYKNIDK